MVKVYMEKKCRKVTFMYRICYNYNTCVYIVTKGMYMSLCQIYVFDTKTQSEIDCEKQEQKIWLKSLKNVLQF